MVQNADARRRRHATSYNIIDYQAVLERLCARHPPKPGSGYTEYLKTQMAEGRINEFRMRQLLRAYLDGDVTWRNA